MTEEVNDISQKRSRGPNKIDILEKEVAHLKELILAMAHYTGTGTVMTDLGVNPKDLYVPTRREMTKRKA